MKKLIVAAFLCLFGVAMAEAGYVEAMKGPATALPSADYGGVSIATISYSTGSLLVFKGGGTFNGFILSSWTTPSTTDFMMLSDTGGVILPGLTTTVSTDGARADAELSSMTLEGAFQKIMLTSATATGFAGQPVQAGMSYTPPFPLRVKNGLKVRFSTKLIEYITVLYNKFE